MMSYIFNLPVITACRNKSDFSFLIPTSAVNVTLVTFAAEHRAAACAAVFRVRTEHGKSWKVLELKH